MTTVNVETSVATAEEDAATKGDLKVVCEGVTRNLEMREWEGDDAFLILFL